MKEIFDTICAPSTPLKESGIAVIRISGPSALKIAEKVFETNKKIEPEKVIRGKIKISDIEDRAILLYFKEPHSYTGEDVVELQIHGNPLLVKKVIEALVHNGCRLAEPGEFTKRAFLNGKMDLLQAEAVARLISAKSEMALKIASRVRKGELSERILELRENLLKLLVSVEGSIEFPDDVEVSDEEIIERMKRLRDAVRNLIKRGNEGRRIFEGYKAVITGKPNVGKSTLFNQLLGFERAIVSPYPGTTRDYIDSVIFLEGKEVRFYDTAGLRNSFEPVEEKGIKIATRLKEEADIIILLFDGSEPPDEEDLQLVKSMKENSIPVLNKVDKGIKEEWGKLGLNFLKISALRGEGIEELKREIARRISHEMEDEIFVTEMRHLKLLEEAEKELEFALESPRNLELLAESLRFVNRKLEELLGITTDEVIEEIFKNFCVGK
jgi:tRNA modification GTPase